MPYGEPFASESGSAEGSDRDVLSTNYGGTLSGMLGPHCHRNYGLGTLEQTRSERRSLFFFAVYICSERGKRAVGAWVAVQTFSILAEGSRVEGMGYRGARRVGHQLGRSCVGT